MLYDVTKKYIMVVEFSVADEKGNMKAQYNVNGANISTAIQNAYTRGVIVRVSANTLQAISPFQIRTIFLIENPNQ